MSSAKEAVSSAVGKFLHAVDRKLHEPGLIDDALQAMEQKSGVKRIHVAGAVVLVHAILLLFGPWPGLLCNLTGLVYPVMITINAISAERVESEKAQALLTYWLVFGLCTVPDYFADTVVHHMPAYWLFKCVFLLYLYLPASQGARAMRNHVIRPLFHSSKVHASVPNPSDKVGEAIKKPSTDIVPASSYEESAKNGSD